MLRRSGGSADHGHHFSREFLKEPEFGTQFTPTQELQEAHMEIPPTQLCCRPGSSLELTQISQDWSHLLSTQVAPDTQIDTQQYPTQIPKESQIDTQVYDFGLDWDTSSVAGRLWRRVRSSTSCSSAERFHPPQI